MTDITPWYKDAIFIELNTRAFKDSDGDGWGDLPGLTSKLDYLKALGVDAIWLLPIMPSPLRDDGYDVSDFCNIFPAYGTMDDFKTLMNEAHKRELKNYCRNHSQSHFRSASLVGHHEIKPPRTPKIAILRLV